MKDKKENTNGERELTPEEMEQTYTEAQKHVDSNARKEKIKAFFEKHKTGFIATAAAVICSAIFGGVGIALLKSSDTQEGLVDPLSDDDDDELIADDITSEDLEVE